MAGVYDIIKAYRDQHNSLITRIETCQSIVDNYTIHKHEKVRNWLKRNKRVSLHFIPTNSSWLNLVERFFGLLTEQQLRRGVFKSVEELEEKTLSYIAKVNEDPKPFVWVKSADEILKKVNRARSALDNIDIN